MNSFLGVVEASRQKIKGIMTSLARVLNRLTGGRLSPSAVTLFGFFMHFVIAWLIAKQDFILAGILLIIFGLFDALDGALARLQHTDSSKGMFLDSVTDKMKEVLLYTAAGYALVAGGRSYAAVWAVAAGTCALLVSYTNAWGEVALKNRKNHVQNQTFRTSLMSFDVRMLVLVVGLLFNQLVPALAIIVVGSCFTAISRARLVMSRLD